MDAWEASRFAALCNDTINEAKWGKRADQKQREEDDATRMVCTYNSMILDGKLWSTVRRATHRGQGGYFHQLTTVQKL